MSVHHTDNRLPRGDEASELPSKVPSKHFKEKCEPTNEGNSDLVTFWTRTTVSAENALSSSETESEGQNVSGVYQGEAQDRQRLEEIEVPSVSSMLDITLSTSEVKIKKTDPLHEVNVTPKKSPLILDGAQCLSTFFTEEELESMLPPDAVLNIEDKYFAVLPNTGTPGHTLFQSICQVVTGKDKDYRQYRETIVDFICSDDGWEMLGPNVISIHSPVIPELNSARDLESSEHVTNRKRVYRHYFMEDEMEGSLVELIAAAIQYDFSYTCILLQETEPVGTATCRIFHSFDDTIGHVQNLESVRVKSSSKQQKNTAMNYFLRVGQSPNEWRWTLVVPYMEGCFERSCHSHVMARGSYQAELWNVFGLNWSKGNFLIKRHPRNYFSWRSALSVLPTSSGKLLGKVMTPGTDLFSILCCSIANCVHVDDQCLMRDAVDHCPSKLSLKNLNDSKLFAAIVLKNKRNCRKKDKVGGTGTLEDLQKASKIYSFGYYVISINEFGDFRSMGRVDKDKNIVYLLARTRYNIITEWCALGDMRVFKRMSASEVSLFDYQIPQELPPDSPPLSLPSRVPSKTGSQTYAASVSDVPTETGSMKRIRLGVNHFFANLRQFLAGISRRTSRSRVYHRKVFPSTDDPPPPSNIDTKNNNCDEFKIKNKIGES